MLMVPQKWGPEDVLEARPVSPGLREETEVSQGFSKLGARSLVRAVISRGLLSSRGCLDNSLLDAVSFAKYFSCELHSLLKAERRKGEGRKDTESPGGSDSRESACSAGDLGSVPGLGRSPGGGQGNPLQYSCLDNPHGQRSLAGCSPWDHKESDMTERLSTHSLLTVYL